MQHVLCYFGFIAQGFIRQTAIEKHLIVYVYVDAYV